MYLINLLIFKKMSKNLYVMLFLFIINIFIKKVIAEENPDDITKKINHCFYQGYNITDPNDIFFSDICSVFYPKNKKDVSLEYRRKYYYYPDYNQSNPIVLNETTSNERFPEIKRNNIFSCFKHHLSLNIIIYNIPLYIIIILFIIQIVSFFFIFFSDYKNASKNTSEKYFNYLKKKKKKSGEKIEENNNDRVDTNTSFRENQGNGFSPLNEETKKDGEGTTDPQIDKRDEQNQIEFDSLHKQDIIEIKDSNELEQEQESKETQKNDMFTFQAKDIPIEVKSEKQNKNKIRQESKIKNVKKIFNRMNNKPIKEKKVLEKRETVLSPDELFYSHFTPAYLLDKRTLKQMYFDILTHCQIFFKLLQKVYIYEDFDVILLYYSIKLELYFIFNILVLNSDSIINKIYDNKFSFFNCLGKCFIATILVNIFSQILFIFTNSKKQFITHINKMKNSLIGKSNIFKLALAEVKLIINNTLFGKLIILCVLNVFIFITTFYCILCFCSTYYYTKFIVLENIVLGIVISQTFPFILAFIPAFLRKRSLKKKNEFEISEVGRNINEFEKNKEGDISLKGRERLYYFSQFVNSVFVP